MVIEKQAVSRVRTELNFIIADYLHFSVSREEKEQKLSGALAS
jgi:hypothetical protein